MGESEGARPGSARRESITVTEHEPEWMRDQRLRGEEARMVLIESNVAATKASAEATHELLLEERKARRAAEDSLNRHEADDISRFSSIDSRLQGMQTQFSTVIDTLARLERTVTTGAADHENRIKTLEEDRAGRTAVARWLRSAWVQLGIGASIGGTLVGVYTLIV